MWLFTCVYDLMVDQMRLPSEASSTLGTLEWLLPCVDYLVFPKM